MYDRKMREMLPTKKGFKIINDRLKTGKKYYTTVTARKQAKSCSDDMITNPFTGKCIKMYSPTFFKMLDQIENFTNDYIKYFNQRGNISKLDQFQAKSFVKRKTTPSLTKLSKIKDSSSTKKQPPMVPRAPRRIIPQRMTDEDKKAFQILRKEILPELKKGKIAKM